MTKRGFSFSTLFSKESETVASSEQVAIATPAESPASPPFFMEVTPIAQLPLDALRARQWRLEIDLVLRNFEDQSLLLVSRTSMSYLLFIDEHAIKRIQKSDLLDRFHHAIRAKLRLNCEAICTGSMEALLLAQSQLNQQLVTSDTPLNEQRTGAHRNFNLLIESALAIDASDVHLEFRDETEINVRFRVHGKLHAGQRQTSLFRDYGTMLDAVTAAYNSRADTSSRSHNHFDENAHQSCSIPITIKGRHYQLRLQSIKENRGLDIILRILLNEAREADVMSVAALGYSIDQVTILENAVHRSPGLLIIAGETGSGKSTTLRTLMTYERASGKKFYSIEDPVEYIQPHVTQIPIQRKAEAGGSSAFGAASRVVLRGDPDKIMPGEIRDAETAAFAKSMTETGHQVLSTVHASSCFGILQRLTSEELAMPLHTVAAPNFLVALVYQKLMPQLCQQCRIPARERLSGEQIDVIEKLGFAIDTIYVTGTGCAKCKYLGTHRQTVAAEVCEIDEDMLPLIAERRFWEIEKRWRLLSDGSPTSASMLGKHAMEHALFKMSLGEIDPADVEAAFYPLRKLLAEKRAHQTTSAGARVT